MYVCSLYARWLNFVVQKLQTRTRFRNKITHSQILRVSALFLCCAVLEANAAAEKPTHEEVQQFLAECAAADLAPDFVAKFGTDYSGLDLSDVSFKGSRFSTGLARANFQACDLSGATLHWAQCDGVNFRDADLSNISANNASFRAADLRGAKLDGASFYYSRFQQARAAGVDFSKSEMRECRFSGADLSNSTFAGIKNDLTWCVFSEADLTGADLSGIDFTKVDFRNATLVGTKFSGANLHQADFTGADLQDVQFDRANLYGAIFENVQGIDEQTLQNLRRRAARGRFEFFLGIKDLLETPIFPLLLFLVAGPWAVFLATNWRKRRAAADSMQQHSLQFGIRSLLIFMTLVALFVSVGSLSLFALYSLTIASAFYLMVAQVALDRIAERSARVSWLAIGAACIYPLLNFLFFVMAGPFNIFDGFFIALTTLIAPLAAIVAGVTVVIRRSWRAGHIAWLSAIGFALWIACIAFANLWLISEIAAGV